MAKEKKKTAKQIVEQALPKVRVLEPTPAPVTDADVPPPTSGKSIGELRRKYLGESAESAAGPSDVDVSASTSSTTLARVHSLLRLTVTSSASTSVERQRTS